MARAGRSPSSTHRQESRNHIAKGTHDPSARPQTGYFLTFLTGFGPREWSQRRENGRGMPGGPFSGPGDHSGPISDHFRRFRARPLICDLNIVTLPQLRLLRHQHCVLTQDRCLLLQQRTCLLLGQDRCLLLRQDRCLLLRQDRCLLLRQDRCLLLRQDICKMVRQGPALSY